jgi:hypothetical protein
MKPEYVFDGHEVPCAHVISIGAEMDRAKMAGVPDPTSATEVMWAYSRIGSKGARGTPQLERLPLEGQ